MMTRSLRFLFLAFVCLVAGVARADYTIYTITVTNASGINTNGTCTITYNGSTRTATNIISSSPQTLFYGTNNTAQAKTNLYQHLQFAPFGSGSTLLSLANKGSTNFYLIGKEGVAVTVTVAGNWGTAVATVVPTTNGTPVIVPVSVYPLQTGTNTASGVAEMLERATNSLSATATVLSNYPNKFGIQVLSNKTIYSSVMDGAQLTNVTSLSGSNGTFANLNLQRPSISNASTIITTSLYATGGYLTNMVIESDTTNIFKRIVLKSGGGINIGGTSVPPTFVNGFQAIGTVPTAYLNGFSDTPTSNPQFLLQRSRGGEGNSTNIQSGDKIGDIDFLGLSDSGAYREAFHIAVTANGDFIGSRGPTLATISVGKTNSLSPQLVVGMTAVQMTNNVDVINNSNVTTLGVAYFATINGAQGSLTNMTGYFGLIYITNANILGGSVSNVMIKDSTLTNATFVGTNSINGDLSVRLQNYTSVGIGHNRLDLGTNVFLNITGSPGATWQLASMVCGVATVPRAGQLAILRNGTTQPCDIVNNDTGEATAAYRFTTSTGTNITFTNGQMAIAVYSGSTWWVAPFVDGYGVTASATNVIATFTNMTVWQSGASVAETINALIGSATNAWQFLWTNGIPTALINSNGTFTLRGITGRTNDALTVTSTNLQSIFGVDSNSTTYAQALTGSTSDIVQFKTTNGVAIGGVHSNHLAYFTNVATTPIPANTGGAEVPVAWRLFSLTNSVTVTNTTAATSLITNALWGTNWIPGNRLSAGSAIRTRAEGYMTSASATVTTFGFRSGNGLDVCTNILALPTTLVNDLWSIEATIVIRSIGASGSACGAGYIQYNSSAGGASAWGTRRLQSGAIASNVTIDTTSPFLIDLYVAPGATTHGFTLVHCFAEVIP